MNFLGGCKEGGGEERKLGQEEKHVRLLCTRVRTELKRGKYYDECVLSFRFRKIERVAWILQILRTGFWEPGGRGFGMVLRFGALLLPFLLLA